jgi:hypothetical protein
MEMRPIDILDRRPGVQLAAVGLLGCGAALFLGVVAATRYGVLAGSAIIAVAFLAVAATTYARDPIQALIGLWLFEVLNAPLSAMFGYFSRVGQSIRQGDEFLVLLFLVFTVLRTLGTTIRLPPARFVLPSVGIALFGILGAINHDVPLGTAALGLWLGLKLWIMIILTLLLPWEREDVARIFRVITVVGLLVAGLGFVDFVTHGALSRALHTANYNVREGGYRSEAVHSIFPTPGEYSLFMSLLFGLVIARFTSTWSRSDLILAILFAASVVLTLRLKGFLSLTTVVAVVGLFQASKGGRRAATALAVGLLLLGIAYSVEGSVISKQLSTYTSSESTARSSLYSTGEQIARDNFPFGVGFGRFASYPSRLSYSPVYYQYKLNRVYGLSPTYPSFIDDTSWPSVIGETGYGGFACYVLALLFMIAAAIRLLRAAPEGRKWIPLACLCMISVLVVDSLGDPSLFSWLATATVAMIVAPMWHLTLSGRQES